MSDDTTESSDITVEALKNAFTESIKIKKKRSKCVTFSRKLPCHTQEYLAEINATETILLDIQIEENRCLEQHYILWQRYRLQEQVLVHIMQFIDAFKLELKASQILATLLNSLTLRENFMNENLSKVVRKFDKGPEFDSWNHVKSNIQRFVESFESIEKLNNEFEDRKRDYEMALKNFKTILEFMDLNPKDIVKLKYQFEGVLSKYQQSRCILDQSLTQLVDKNTIFLGEVCGLIGRQYEQQSDFKNNFSSLLDNIKSAFKGEIMLMDFSSQKAASI